MAHSISFRCRTNSATAFALSSLLRASSSFGLSGSVPFSPRATARKRQLPSPATGTMRSLGPGTGTATGAQRATPPRQVRLKNWRAERHGVSVSISHRPEPQDMALTGTVGRESDLSKWLSINSGRTAVISTFKETCTVGKWVFLECFKLVRHPSSSSSSPSSSCTLRWLRCCICRPSTTWFCEIERCQELDLGWSQVSQSWLNEYEYADDPSLKQNELVEWMNLQDPLGNIKDRFISTQSNPKIQKRTISKP